MTERETIRWIDAEGNLAEADMDPAAALELSAGRAVPFEGEVRRVPAREATITCTPEVSSASAPDAADERAGGV